MNVFFCIYLHLLVYKSRIWMRNCPFITGLLLYENKYARQISHDPIKWQKETNSKKSLFSNGLGKKIENKGAKQRKLQQRDWKSGVFSAHFRLYFYHTCWVLDSDGSIDSQVVDCATRSFTHMIIGPFLETSNSDDELDFHRKPKRSYCGNRMACQSRAISLFSLFIRWCVKIRTLSAGGFKTLRGNEEPCGSSTADVWKLRRVTVWLSPTWSWEELKKKKTLRRHGRNLRPIKHQRDVHENSWNLMNPQNRECVLTSHSFKPLQCQRCSSVSATETAYVSDHRGP